MILIDDFAHALSLDEDMIGDAYEIFCEEVRAPSKTLAARAADLAEGLRQIGLDEQAVAAAVQQLAMERGR